MSISKVKNATDETRLPSLDLQLSSTHADDAALPRDKQCPDRPTAPARPPRQTAVGDAVRPVHSPGVDVFSSDTAARPGRRVRFTAS